MKNNKSGIPESIARIALFGIVFLALVWGLSNTVFSRRNAAGYKNLYSDTYAYTLETPGSVSVVGVGNSDLYSAFVPNVLWEEFGFPSVVSGAPCDTVKSAYGRLSDILSAQKPSVVLIEADMIYRDNAGNTGISSAGRVRNLLAFMRGDGIEDYFGNVFPVFLFHDRWKSGCGTAEKEASDHGYVYSGEICRFGLSPDYMRESSPEEIAAEDKAYLEKTIGMCRNHGAVPVLVAMPSPASWNGARHAGAEAFAEENGIVFIDLNSIDSGYRTDYACDFRDAGNHLNYCGAEKATVFLGGKLAALGILEDMRGDPEYTEWNTAAEIFYGKTGMLTRK